MTGFRTVHARVGSGPEVAGPIAIQVVHPARGGLVADGHRGQTRPAPVASRVRIEVVNASTVGCNPVGAVGVFENAVNRVVWKILGARAGDESRAIETAEAARRRAEPKKPCESRTIWLMRSCGRPSADA